MTERKGTYRLFEATRRFTSARLDLVAALNNVKCQAEVQQLFENVDVADIVFVLLEEPNKKQRHESAKGIISLIKNELYLGKKLFEKGCVTIFLRYIQFHQDYTFRALMMDALRELCILDEAFTNQILESEGIETFLIFLNHHNEDLKVSAAWAIAYLAKSSKRLAEEVVQKGAVSILVIQMSEGSIKGRLAAIDALSHIILQSAQLAEVCAQGDCIIHLLDNIRTFKDISVQYQCLCTLASMAISNYKVAQLIAQSSAIVDALQCVKSSDSKVACTACCFLANVMHCRRKMAEKVAVHRGCIAAILSVIDKFKSSECKWAILCIGCISSLSNTKAMEVLLTILPNGNTFTSVLNAYLMVEKKEDAIKSIIWLLYSLAYYSHNHAHYVCHTMIMNKCVEWCNCAAYTASVQMIAMKTLTLLLDKCEYPPALNALLPGITIDLLKMSLGQYMKILPVDVTSRKVFFISGALEKLQQIRYKPGSALHRQIAYINTCFPREIIEQLNLDFAKVLWIKVKDSDLLRDLSESFIYSRFTESVRYAKEQHGKVFVTKMPRFHFLDPSYLSFSDVDSDSKSVLGVPQRMETYAEPSFMELEPPVFDSVQPSTSVQLDANTPRADDVESEFLNEPPLEIATNKLSESARRPSGSVTIVELVSEAAPGSVTSEIVSEAASGNNTFQLVSEAASGSKKSEKEVEQRIRRQLMTLLKGRQF